jgi:hypothetical protein
MASVNREVQKGRERQYITTVCSPDREFRRREFAFANLRAYFANFAVLPFAFNAESAKPPQGNAKELTFSLPKCTRTRISYTAIQENEDEAKHITPPFTHPGTCFYLLNSSRISFAPATV